jgi:hypothetical protein
MERKILHLDLDAFFCAVEELLNPDLKGKAFAVGGSPNSAGLFLPVRIPPDNLVSAPRCRWDARWHCARI